MKNDREVSDLAEDGADLYPHLKVTTEMFPRILATRRIEDDAADYYGAFLTRTSVRILIDLVNRLFKLRSCDIHIDGSFAVPCTQFYLKRCIAPCVADLCPPPEYAAMVGLVRMFLGDRRGDLRAALKRLMAQSSDKLDFEMAVYWRDMLHEIEEFWNDPRLSVWLDDAVDTFDADESAAGSFIYLVTQRGRNVLGRKVFRLPPGGGLLPHEALPRIIDAFYRFHLPKEIRVSMSFEGRRELQETLSRRFGRPASIVLVRPDRQRVTAVRALRSAWSENELEFVKSKATARQISGELKRSFGLADLPMRVEAFDVAHISGLFFVAAATVWQNGRYLPEEHRFQISAETSEPAAMGDAVLSRLTDSSVRMPDLIVLDGGRAQLNAAMKALGAAGLSGVPVIGAVKPAAKHSSLAEFITAAGRRIEYEHDNPAHNMLRLLRDGAHDLANRVHRDLRDLGHYYELAALLPSLKESERRQLVAAVGSVRKLRDVDPDQLNKLVPDPLASRAAADLRRHAGNEDHPPVIPLIVPIRFDAEDGDAEDLIPISSK